MDTNQCYVNGRLSIILLAKKKQKQDYVIGYSNGTMCNRFDNRPQTVVSQSRNLIS